MVGGLKPHTKEGVPYVEFAPMSLFPGLDLLILGRPFEWYTKSVESFWANPPRK